MGTLDLDKTKEASKLFKEKVDYHRCLFVDAINFLVIDNNGNKKLRCCDQSQGTINSGFYTLIEVKDIINESVDRMLLIIKNSSVENKDWWFFPNNEDKCLYPIKIYKDNDGYFSKLFFGHYRTYLNQNTLDVEYL